MGTIGGKKKEQQNFDNVKRVGLFVGKVIAINPDKEEYKDVLGIDLSDDSKATDYLGTSKDGNPNLRINFWIKEEKSGLLCPVTFFLEDKEKDNKESTKKQYINNVGTTSWADVPENLPKWFIEREYRTAKSGEEDFYNFLRTWLGNLDYRDNETTLELDWKKLMKGNLKDLKEQIDGEWATSFVALATVKTVIKEEETKEYQSIYNGAFLPEYCLKQFRLVNYQNDGVLIKLQNKKSKDLKPIERFVVKITGEYGCKDFYLLKDLKEYNTDDNLVASDKVISEEGDDY
jgi:hypothetical protein